MSSIFIIFYIILIILLLFFLILIIGMSNYFSKVYTKQKFPDINYENISPVDNIIVYTLGTSMNKFLWNMLSSLNQNNHSYKLIGINEKWGGWRWRIEKYIDTIKDHKIKYGDTIMIFIDGYDAFAIKNKNGLYEKFLEKGKKIVVGAEDAYVPTTPNIGKVENWWGVNNHLNKEDYKNKYMNAGFIMGYPNELLNMYEWVYNEGYKDDQIGTSNYVNKYPENVYLDFNSEFVYNKIAYRKFNKNLNSYFMHCPGYAFPFTILFGIDFDIYYKMYLKTSF